MKKFNDWFNSKYSWFFTNGRKAQSAYNKTFTDEVNIVSIVLANAYQMSLEVEVVTWALKYMKENPNLTIDEAITMSYSEWVK